MLSSLFKYFEIDAITQMSAFKQMALLASKELSIEANKILNSLQEREKVANTALIEGIALPHIIIDKIDKPKIFVFLDKHNIEDWQDLNNESIRILICYILPARVTYTDTSVRVLRKFSVKLADDQFIDRISSCRTISDLRDTIKDT
ncbi:PTS sugar transporter subunit IIA [Lactobacillus crispatus]|uniref:PTS sugar transporter subunit IIA n=1 Tax=Lactobacillus crispatus TaxID=47770 RepID=UPI0014738E0A|nr:PTS sugar transporter subunit IIA [Lactobacillus crispatus]MBE5059090.1 PTS sugar transporter subunit IIA [Lactobacillus crispatus]NME26926.1 PTS sugar transporter subunit IIA [Lactobacillus crispatus]